MKPANDHVDSQLNCPLQLRASFGALKLIALLCLSLPLSTWASIQLYLIYQPNDMRALEWVQLVLASMLFIWLAISFWTAVIGFVLSVLKLNPLTLKKDASININHHNLAQRHALVMPVYNEDTLRIMAGFEACIKEIAQYSHQSQFDFYMLSDTQHPELIKAEKSMWSKVLSTLPKKVKKRCFYRRRKQNTEKKVGNLKDFFQQWGSLYCGVIVLDADSIMNGETMIELALRLEHNSKVGLIQTIPMPVRQVSIFAKFVQFSSQVHSPMLAKGLNFWQGDCANYWGHNAMIRSKAFIECCGLPKLKGGKPFGGHILSHDFVEAALLKRKQWQVYLLTSDTGSYEEVPTNMIDYAIRDRRWLQGNIQHLGLLGIKGIPIVNRLHMLFGAFAYLSSILLLVILLCGSADAVLKAVVPPVYFPDLYQLFPTWVITPYTLMISTMYVTIALLFLPKLLGVMYNLLFKHKTFGGVFTFLINAMIEFFFAVLIAPIMLLFHSFFVLSSLAGKSVSWEAQAREGKMVSWIAAIQLGSIPMLIAAAWLYILWVYAPALLLWLAPVLTGMFLAIPIIRYSSSQSIGRWCKQRNVLASPKDMETDDCIALVAHLMVEIPSRQSEEAHNPLPKVKWQDMPTQNFYSPNQKTKRISVV